MSTIEGWAFKAPEARTESRDAFLDALEKLGIQRPEINELGGLMFTQEISRKLGELSKHSGGGYAHFTATLDPSTADLTDQQKLLIADHGNGCFGGVVNGLHVKVYTD